MVVHDFDVLGPSRRPAEAEAELVIDPNAVLPGPVALEQFESVAGRNPKVVESFRDLQLAQFATRNRLNRPEPSDAATACQGRRVCAPERSDHQRIITRHVIIVKRDGRKTWFGQALRTAA